MVTALLALGRFRTGSTTPDFEHQGQDCMIGVAITTKDRHDLLKALTLPRKHWHGIGALIVVNDAPRLGCSCRTGWGRSSR